MEMLLVVALGLVVTAAARPDTIFDFEDDDAEHEQKGVAGKAVTGEYKWESPEGLDFKVKYIADDRGYRVIEYNAVPLALPTPRRRRPSGRPRPPGRPRPTRRPRPPGRPRPTRRGARST
ncbi:uncharacterized protein LOC126988295 [Eriocheir sinensis]|uniref:uncharacterized protein LOC126988295 n=1 Tax=Eriocheir sinensis TaxID=95602 RepID=UPI0021C9B4DF|nr:uncharacterized protein LOC126988295 [Eriocheir sinensis]